MCQKKVVIIDSRELLFKFWDIFDENLWFFLRIRLPPPPPKKKNY